MICFLSNKPFDIVLYPIKKNPITFFFIYVLGVMTMLIQVFHFNFKIPRFDFLSNISDAYFFCIVLILLPNRIRKYMEIFGFFALYVLSVVDAFCVHTFSAKIGPEIVNVMLETNSRESAEFLEKYVNISVLFSGVGLIATLAFLHLFVIYKKNWIKTKVIYLLEYIRKSFNIDYVKIPIMILVVGSILFCFPYRFIMVKILAVDNIERMDELINNYTLNTPTNNMLFSLKMRRLSEKDLGVLAENVHKMSIDSCSYRSTNIVLVIGESYIKGHSQLYGYDKHTTPQQVKWNRTGRLVAFSDVVSPSNLTSIVFKNSFSLHSIGAKSNWSSSSLFPVLFRKAGYRVCFLTNQFVKSLQQDVFNATGGLFLNESHLSNAMFDSRNNETHRYDGSLLEDFDSLKSDTSKYNLFIFHLAGQHIDFGKRCPDERKLFKVNDYSSRTDLNDKERQIVADYDNATLYNDDVIEMILNRFEREDAVVIYMPDHGEECYDELHRMGRMPQGDISPQMARQEFRIPFWIWGSKKYIDSHLQIWNQICVAKDNPFMTDDLPHLLLYLAGIFCEEYKESKNVISPKFDKKRPRLLNGQIDYDKLIRVQK